MLQSNLNQNTTNFLQENTFYNVGHFVILFVITVTLHERHVVEITSKSTIQQLIHPDIKENFKAPQYWP